MMSANRQIAAGQNSIQIQGDHNTVVEGDLFLSQKGAGSLTKSEIHRLLRLVQGDAPASRGKGRLAVPAEMKQKLLFNDAPKYIHKFKNHSVTYQRLQEVARGFASNEDIVEMLADFYYDVVEYGPEGDVIVGDGDSRLDAVKEHLHDLLTHDASFDANEFSEEKLNQFLVALLQYGVSLCRVLENPGGYASS